MCVFPAPLPCSGVRTSESDKNLGRRGSTIGIPTAPPCVVTRRVPRIPGRWCHAQALTVIRFVHLHATPNGIPGRAGSGTVYRVQRRRACRIELLNVGTITVLSCCSRTTVQQQDLGTTTEQQQAGATTTGQVRTACCETSHSYHTYMYTTDVAEHISYLG